MATDANSKYIIFWFDENVLQITDGDGNTVTGSGGQIYYEGILGFVGTLYTVTLADGYVIDTVDSVNIDSIDEITDNTFTLTTEANGAIATITITTKAVETDTDTETSGGGTMSKYLDLDGLSYFKDKLEDNLETNVNPVVSTTIDSKAVLTDETADITSLAAATVEQGEWTTSEGTDNEDYETASGNTYYYGNVTYTVTAALSEAQEADTTVIVQVALRYKTGIDTDDENQIVHYYTDATKNVTVTIPAGETTGTATGSYRSLQNEGSATASVVSATTSAYTEQQTLTVKHLDGTTNSYTFNSIIVSTSSTSGGSSDDDDSGSTDTYDSVLNNNTWAQISAASSAGVASSLWSVGDIKAVTLSGTVGTLAVDETLYAFILGFNHNADLEGNNLIHFGCFMTEDGIDTCLVDSNYWVWSDSGTKYFSINHYMDYNYGGWGACDLRYDVLGSTDVPPNDYGDMRSESSVGYDATSTCATSPVSGTLMAAFESSLRAVMKPITKYTDNVGGGIGSEEGNISATVDYLPLLSEYEVFGEDNYGYGNSYEYEYQKQYDYYANGNEKIKYCHGDSEDYEGHPAGWWLRSPYYDDCDLFCLVGEGGGGSSGGADYSLGLAPLFAV